MTHRICLITCYMGPLPNYFPYFISSCKKNKDIQFIVLNDSITQSETIENIELIKFDIQALNALSTLKLNAPVTAHNAWKINEYKPLFGILFDDKIKNFDFWGWCDLDIVWGDLRKFLTPELLNSHDVVVFKQHWTAGHFTLFRNTEYNNNLFRMNPTIIDLLNDKTYYAFEECCHRWEGKINSFDWITSQGLPISMFDIVKTAEKQGKIKAYFKDSIREFPQPINYLYKEGRLIDLSNKEEFAYYHLITVKKIWRFYIPYYKTIPETLYFSAYGIRSEKEKKNLTHALVWWTKRAISCYQGIKKSIKSKNIFQVVKKIFTGKF